MELRSARNMPSMQLLARPVCARAGGARARRQEALICVRFAIVCRLTRARIVAFSVILRHRLASTARSVAAVARQIRHVWRRPNLRSCLESLVACGAVVGCTTLHSAALQLVALPVAALVRCAAVRGGAAATAAQQLSPIVARARAAARQRAHAAARAQPRTPLAVVVPACARIMLLRSVLQSIENVLEQIVTHRLEARRHHARLTGHRQSTPPARQRVSRQPPPLQGRRPW